MANVYICLPPESAILPSSTFPQLLRISGTNFPISGWAFDASLDEAIFFKFRASKYGSGNLTVHLDWYADTASSGDVVWGCAIAAITPDADAQDVETKSLAAENTSVDSHLGTVGQRLHRATVSVSNLDSLAADDWVVMRIRRLGSSASDTMTGDAIMTLATVVYSDV